MAQSIYDQKRAFIESQIRLLAVPLRPSAEWETQFKETAGKSFLERAIRKVQHTQRKQMRQIFSIQAINHVALQLNQLYRERVRAATTSDSAVAFVAGDERQAILRNERDLVDPDTIEQLPETWEELSGSSQAENADDLERYLLLRDQLLTLASALRASRRRAAQLDELHRLVEQFRDPVSNVQPNLISRDGAIERELTRMRVLLARLAARRELQDK
ncbi:kinetochore Sim4 complex subunit Fta4 [Lipomyces oligophaga]|uniref:kinetochore Sim4 complex subunit Fta4 n=1 Tax=Lipomyces oligophaga TaxID=45792 RepID=UPI0034CF1918